MHSSVAPIPRGAPHDVGEVGDIGEVKLVGLEAAMRDIESSQDPS